MKTERKEEILENGCGGTKTSRVNLTPRKLEETQDWGLSIFKIGAVMYGAKGTDLGSSGRMRIE